MARPCPLSARTPSSLRLAASMPDPLQLRFARQGTLLVLYAVGESGRWIGIIPPVRARFALRFPRRIASPPAKAFKGKDRAAGAVSSLWWPRRPLATLGRKLRQGRKAATVSIDAGAEVSRRGRHPFPENTSARQMRSLRPDGFWQAAAVSRAVPQASILASRWHRPWRRRNHPRNGSIPTARIDRRGRRGQPAGSPPLLLKIKPYGPIRRLCAVRPCSRQSRCGRRDRPYASGCNQPAPPSR